MFPNNSIIIITTGKRYTCSPWLYKRAPNILKKQKLPAWILDTVQLNQQKRKNVTHRYIQQSTCQNSLPWIEGWTDNKSTIRSTTTFLATNYYSVKKKSKFLQFWNFPLNRALFLKEINKLSSKNVHNHQYLRSNSLNTN